MRRTIKEKIDSNSEDTETRRGKINSEFEQIVLMEYTKLEEHVTVLIRNTLNPFASYPVAVVDCKCGNEYKKKLFYLSDNFSKDEKLTCPKCDYEIKIFYKRAPRKR